MENETVQESSLNSDSDDYEECLLLLEFTGIIDDEFLQHCQTATEPCQILGLDSASPVLQLGDFSFQGKYEVTLGTTVLFEKRDASLDNSGSSDSPDEAELEYFDTTNKKLTLTRIFLTEKKDNNDSMETDSSR